MCPGRITLFTIFDIANVALFACPIVKLSIGTLVTCVCEVVVVGCGIAFDAASQSFVIHYCIIITFNALR